MSLKVLCCVWAVALAASAADQPPLLRLSEVQSVTPSNYQVDLTLDPLKDDFSGTIVIQLEIAKATQTIWLNQEKIVVKEALLTAGGKTLKASVLPGGDDYLGFHFDAPIATGRATLKINYTGTVVTKNSSGIFRQPDNGNWYIFTQFEATDARAAFPCFDEPSYKTPWQLTLHIPTGDTAISNTGIANEKGTGVGKTMTFRQTKPLPSYLVAFAVGPFEYVDAGKAGKNQVPVRIVVPKGHAAEAKYAASVTAEIINKHEQYFGYPYPYDKADQVAIPDTAGFGAMENPGMVTYAQNLILAKPEVDTIHRQRGYVSVAAHELAHQWFGDLVTTQWWNDIWLNEAFATWKEQKLLDEWKPEWKTDVADVAAKIFAEGEDSLVSARKVRQPIEAKDDINNAFDGITYQKGAAVIGMFESWMGPNDFQKGVQSYMKQYAFRATTAGDFLDSLSSAGKKDITRAFSTFLNQAGVPVVSVALQCDNGVPTLHLEQQRFLPLGSKGSADQKWEIPVCARYESGGTTKSECTLLTEKSADWKLKTSSCPAWVQANDRAVGYYRVDYRGNLLAALTKGNVTERLSAPERADLIGNARALANAGKLSAAQALALVDTFHNDPERQVVQSSIDLALRPRAYLVSDELKPNYERFLQKNFQAKARELGWTPKPGESDDVRLLRPALVPVMATRGGDKELAAQAKPLVEQWFSDHRAIDPNMVSAVLNTAAFYGDAALFQRFLAELKNTKDKQVRQQILGALQNFRDPAAIQSGLTALVAGDVPFIEGAGMLFSGQGEAATRMIPLEFLKAHFDEVVSKMPTGGGFDFGSVLPQVGASYCDEKSKAELKDFLEPRTSKFVGAPRALQQTLEGIDLCIAQTASQKPSVAAFLQNY
jgi:alanyl aminopeptidase